MTVEILKGEDKGLHGSIEKIVKERNLCLIKGLNLKKTLTSNENGETYLDSKQEPLDVLEDVALIDPSDYKPTAVEWKLNDKGEKVRVSVRTGRELPIPAIHLQTHEDGTDMGKYKRNKRSDTVTDVVNKVTYKPSLKTFEEDMMETFGIKEERKPPKTYWY